MKAYLKGNLEWCLGKTIYEIDICSNVKAEDLLKYIESKNIFKSAAILTYEGLAFRLFVRPERREPEGYFVDLDNGKSFFNNGKKIKEVQKENISSWIWSDLPRINKFIEKLKQNEKEKEEL